LPGIGNTATDYVFWAEARVLNTSCSCQDCVSLTRTPVTLHINPRPFAPTTPVSATNCAFQAVNPPLSVSTNNTGITGNTVTVDWYDAPAGGTLLTNNSLTFTPTNNSPGAGDTATTYVFWAESRVAWNTNCFCQDCVSTNRTPVTLYINPVPPAPVPVMAFVTNCITVPNPALAVTVTNGATADWFDANMASVFTNSLTFTNTSQLPGIYTNYIFASFNNSDCLSTNFATIVFVNQICTNQISSITLDNGTNAIIQWYGDFVLESTTNLLPPANWSILKQGMGGQDNFWTNPILSPPTNSFFRLYAPTN
jgi:hypothetical protein